MGSWGGAVCIARRSMLNAGVFVNRAQKMIKEVPQWAELMKGGDLKKLLSAPAFQFKGTGWYVTDYADKGKGKGGRDKGEGKDSGESKTKDSAKSESKDSAKPTGGKAEKASSD